MLLSMTYSPKMVLSYGDPPIEGKAVLQTLKWVDKTIIKLGDNLTVHVNITNWSTEHSYNLSISEPLFNNWSLSYFKDYDHYQWIEIKAGASLYYEYTVKLISEGNYTINPTVVTYFDENNTQYIAKSGIIPIYVYQVPPKEDNSTIWKNILWYSLAIIALPVIILIIKKIIWK